MTINGGAGSNTIDGRYLVPNSSFITINHSIFMNADDGGRMYFTKNKTAYDQTYTVVYFTNVGTIQGAPAGGQLDLYEGSLSGKFYGNTSPDGNKNPFVNDPYFQLTYAYSVSDVTVDLRNNSAVKINSEQSGGFSGVPLFIGSDYDTVSTVYLPNANNTYAMTVNGINTTQASDFFECRFFDQYIGGSGNDTFVFTQDTFIENEVASLLVGGGGINVMDFRSLSTLPSYTFDSGTGSGSITQINKAGNPVTINFTNMNFVYLPGVTLVLVNSRIDIITQPESSVISSAEDKGINLIQGTIRPTGADIRFIINNQLSPREIGGTAIPLTFSPPEEKDHQLFVGETYFAQKNLNPLFKARVAELKDTELESVAKNCQFSPLPEIKLEKL